MKAQLGRITLALLLLLAVPFRVQGHDLGLGQFDTRSIHPEAAETLEEILKKGRLSDEFTFYEHGEVRGALDDMIQRLSSAPGNQRYLAGIDYNPMVFEGGRINALAHPEGKVILSGRMILELGSEEHLMAIMAHEMAHVSRGHMHRKVDRWIRTGHTIAATEQDALKLLLGGYRFFNGQHLSRAFEFEADQVAMQLLDNAGINPARMPEALEKLERIAANVPEHEVAVQKPGWLRRGFNLLQTHPHTYVRMQRAQSEILAHGYRRAIEPLRPNGSRFQQMLRVMREQHWRFRF